jgi:hypothetical protein
MDSETYGEVKQVPAYEGPTGILYRTKGAAQEAWKHYKYKQLIENSKIIPQEHKPRLKNGAYINWLEKHIDELIEIFKPKK